MKTTLALIALMAIGITVIAQEKKSKKSSGDGSRRRGYIGFSIGPSFPVGDFKKQSPVLEPGLTGTETTKTGLQLTLVNFGYLFTEHVGIAGSWFGTAYDRRSNFRKDLEPWSCGGLMVGPLFSFPLSEKIEWDFRPMIGYSVCTGQRQSAWTESAQANEALLLNMGTVLRFHLAKRSSLLFTADYFSTTMKFKEDGSPDQSIKAISLGLGFAFRLR